MDELRITGKLMTSIVSKAIGMALKKKLGYKIDVRVNELVATFDGDMVRLHVDADGDVSVNEFKKFTKVIGLED